MDVETAKADVKAAMIHLHGIVASGGTFQEKRNARNKLEAKQAALFSITGDVNDLPTSVLCRAVYELTHHGREKRRNQMNVRLADEEMAKALFLGDGTGGRNG